MKPLPWSYSSLDDFVNCPRSYYEKRIAKSVKEEPSEQLIWGNKVHKHFENRILHGTELPEELKEHSDYMDELASMGGHTMTERKVALNTKREPCGFFDDNVWWRGVIDFSNINGDHALVVDYKTGKRHQKWRQLRLFALYLFAENKELNIVDAAFYWTPIKLHDVVSYKREEAPKLWSEMAPDLKQYVQAFKTDTWQPRQSGLCHGWCPVTDCEFWQPRKAKT